MAKLTFAFVFALFAPLSVLAAPSTVDCAAASTNTPAGLEIVEEFVARIEQFPSANQANFRTDIHTSLQKALNSVVDAKAFEGVSQQKILSRALAIAANEGRLQQFMDAVIGDRYRALRSMQQDHRYDALAALSQESQQNIAGRLMLAQQSEDAKMASAALSFQSDETKRIVTRAVQVLVSSFSVPSMDMEFLISSLDVTFNRKLNFEKPAAPLMHDLIALLMSREDFKVKAAALAQGYRQRRPSRGEEDKAAIDALASITPVLGPAQTQAGFDPANAVNRSSADDVALMEATFELMKAKFGDLSGFEMGMWIFGDTVKHNYKDEIQKSAPLYQVFRAMVQNLNARGDLRTFNAWLAQQPRR